MLMQAMCSNVPGGLFGRTVTLDPARKADTP